MQFLELQVLIVLNFMAYSSYQKRVGHDYLACFLGTYTISRYHRSNRWNSYSDCFTKYTEETLLLSIENYIIRSNVLIVSDYKGKILCVNAAHGGRTHDARVWKSSFLSNHLQEMNAAGRRDAWLLSDSAYPLLPYLMTPKMNQPEGTPSARYTQSSCPSSFLCGTMHRRFKGKVAMS